jgi:hypothetical protein
VHIFRVELVVQPEKHGGVFRQLEQDCPEIAERHTAEGGDLACHLEGALDLGVPRREQAMPEEHHLLLQRALRVDHAPYPCCCCDVHFPGFMKIGEGAEE